MTLPRFGSKAQQLTAVTLAALAALLVYANSLANGFAYDDLWIIETRELVHGLDRLGELLLAEYWPSDYGSGLYRPLTLFSFALNWSVDGGDPFGFHLVNVVLHAAVAALLTLLLLRFFPWWAALAGGVIFAVHPVHTEAVANVVGRAELLAAAFMILACLVYVRAVQSEGIRWTTGITVTLCYALALASKEGGVVLPALLVLSDLTSLASGRLGTRRAYLRQRLPLFAGLALAAAAYFAVRWAVLGAPVQNVVDRAFEPDSSFGTRLFTMARVWPRLFELLLFPTNLSADYSPAVILPTPVLTPLGVVGFLLVAASLALALISRRRAPELTFAVGWSVVTLLPVSNLIIVAEIVLAERTLYVPSVVVSFLAALVLARTPLPHRRWIAAGLSLWVVGFSVVTVKRNPVWMNSETVFADLQRHHPESSRLLWWLGDRHIRQGNWERAKHWYRRSLEVWPYHAAYLSEFAVQLKDHGELEEAEAMAARAVELAPNRREHHSLLAHVRLLRGDDEGALTAVNRGLARLGPDPLYHALQVEAYRNLGRFAAAAEAQGELVRLRAGNVVWQDWYTMARLRAAAGDTLAGLAALDSARRLAGPEFPAGDSLQALWQAGWGSPGR